MFKGLFDLPNAFNSQPEKEIKKISQPLNKYDPYKNDEDIKGQNMSMKLYKNIPINNKKLIIHCCHHKCGSHALLHILRDISVNFGLKFQYCDQNHLEPDTDIWMENHSHIDFSKITRPIVGTHMVRHPISVIYSAHKYHQKTLEPWANKKVKDLDDKSYREIMSELNEEDGLVFETKNEIFLESSRRTLRDMYIWDYYRPNFLEVRFEDMMSNFDDVLRNMFKFYGWSKKEIIKGLEIAQKHNLENQNNTNINSNDHITNKTLDWEKWREGYNSKRLLQTFKKNYPEDIFNTLGYGNDKETKEKLRHIEGNYCPREKFLDENLLKKNINAFKKYTSKV